MSVDIQPDLPANLNSELTNGTLSPEKYLQLLRTMQEIERLMPGSRFFWPELAQYVHMKCDSGVDVRLYTKAYGTVEQGLYRPSPPLLRDKNPFQGYEFMRSSYHGHERLTAKHGMLLTYTIKLSVRSRNKKFTSRLVPVDAICKLEFIS